MTRRNLVLAFYLVAGVLLVAWPFLLFGCGGSMPSRGTVIRGTLGGLYGACNAVDSDDRTWRSICSAVEHALPTLGQLGAGPADLPPDVAEREVVITIEGER